MIVETIRKQFVEIYNEVPSVYSSPGRINLIGEHIDYNDGFVLPASINNSIYIAVTKRKDSLIKLFSNNYNQSIELDLKDIKPIKGWGTYILGVLYQFVSAGYPLSGVNILISGDIPIGAGLSSSAAIECAIAYSINDLFKFKLDRITLINMAQKAEHEFAGVKCGIMDQFATMMGRKDHVIKLDCKKMDYEYIPLLLQEFEIVLFDSNVKHELAFSEYNKRRSECDAGFFEIQKFFPSVTSFRDVTIDMLNNSLFENKIIYNRCRYVIEENIRVIEACKDLKKNNLIEFGKKMYDTHKGLSKLYDVSCEEIDFLIDEVKDSLSVIGARMMGGGFGGCTINLVKSEDVDNIIKSLSISYNKKTKKDLTAHKIKIIDGTSKIISNEEF